MGSVRLGVGFAPAPVESASTWLCVCICVCTPHRTLCTAWRTWSNIPVYVMFSRNTHTQPCVQRVYTYIYNTNVTPRNSQRSRARRGVQLQTLWRRFKYNFLLNTGFCDIFARTPESGVLRISGGSEPTTNTHIQLSTIFTNSCAYRTTPDIYMNWNTM